MYRVIFFLSILTGLIKYLGPVAAIVFPALWSYDAAQLGASHSEVAFTFCVSFVLMQLAVVATHWILSHALLFVTMLDE